MTIGVESVDGEKASDDEKGVEENGNEGVRVVKKEGNRSGE